MKSFLYAAMLASLTVAGLGMVGCGQKKDTRPAKAYVTEADEDMLDEDLLELLDEESDDEEDMDMLLDELEDDLDEEDDLEEGEFDNIFEGMSPEEIAAAEKEAMAELAELIAREQEKNVQVAGGVGPDMFDAAFNFEGMSPADRASLLAWHEEAMTFAQQELESAARASKELGFENITFASNSAVIPASQRAALAHNIDLAREAIANDHDVVLVGHAEESAPDAMKLSQERATALREAFIAAGLDENRLHATGYGAVLAIDAASSSMAECLIC